MLAIKGNRKGSGLEVTEFIIKKLVESKGDLNIKNNDGDTALMLAIKCNWPGIATLLIEHLVKANSDLNINNNDGNTALTIARNSGLNEITELIESKLKENEKTDNKTKHIKHNKM
jgi:ankyrin repeat protein